MGGERTMSMVDQLRTRNAELVSDYKPHQSGQQASIPTGVSGDSSLLSMQTKVDDKNDEISKLQNRLDCFQHQFSSQELSGEWAQIFACENGVVISRDPQIELDASGKNIVADKRNSPNTREASSMLWFANKTVEQHKSKIQFEIKAREKEIRDLILHIQGWDVQPSPESSLDKEPISEVQPTLLDQIKNFGSFLYTQAVRVLSYLLSFFSATDSK